MKTIPLSEAIALLDKAAAVIVDGSYVTFPNVRPDTEDEKGTFLELARTEENWSNGIGIESFKETANATVEVNEHGELVLCNTKDQKTTIALLARCRADNLCVGA